MSHENGGSDAATTDGGYTTEEKTHACMDECHPTQDHRLLRTFWIHASIHPLTNKYTNEGTG